MAIKAYAPFGYEGGIIDVSATVETGQSSNTQINGLTDNGVCALKDRVQAAIRNQGLEYPSGQVTVNLFPIDIRKNGSGFDLSVALAILAQSDKMPRSQDAKVFVIGELDLSGQLLPVRGTYAAVESARDRGINYAIIPKGSERTPDGIITKEVSNLSEALQALIGMDEAEALGEPYYDNRISAYFNLNDSKTTFAPVAGSEPVTNLNGYTDQGLVYALSLAAAGRHHMIVTGAPGCGKTSTIQKMVQLLPNLDTKEQPVTNRLWSLAGLTKSNSKVVYRPFRMPHQTASIEGICGGGPECRPGEISLAHNGVLFLDEAAEFRASVLQMLRVPLETGQITLSRAGRATSYPANFQLVTATNPCPCGNYGSKDKVCLCSVKAIEQYWKKFSAPLLERMSIRYDCNNRLSVTPRGLEDTRERIKRAVERQRSRQGKFNEELTHDELEKFAPLTASTKALLNLEVTKNNFTARETDSIIKVARTIADMQSTDFFELTDGFIQTAVKLHRKLSF